MWGGSELQNLEPSTLSSCSITANRFEQLASDFNLTNHQSYTTSCPLQFPGTTNVYSYQSSGDKFGIIDLSESEQDTLQSVVKPHLSSRDCNASFKLDEISCCNFHGSGHVLQDQNKLLKNKFPCACASTGPTPILSGKKRIKWTQDLHNRFVECVNHIGGAEKATPKAVLKLMKSNELTIYHVKSHLQKYRFEKYKLEPLQGKPEKGVVCISDIPQLYMKIGKKIQEALQMQQDVQMHLHHQLEIQQNLQMVIEEQGKQLKIMLEKQQEKRTYK
ncbi:hypothetical protein Dsin_007109 [Dipteronia sinensis]|uniref:HTH myb-type domain-containing protein n=1 Tax=Dipteronia sinensis TaxID=43782 RepID=A0AAE0B0U2_9ROSI|nr:hypothetical protein Dsin_007109 [Dipteronia sinensis]